MSRTWHRLRYFVADAWEEWRRSPGVNLLAVATLASTLFLAAVVVLVVANVERQVVELREEVRAQVFLVDDLNQALLEALRADLEGMAGVAGVEYVDKAEALRRYRQWAKEMADLAAGLEHNPLPASFDVYLEPGPQAEAAGEALVEEIGEREEVEEVRFDRAWLHRLESLLRLARIGGTCLAVVVFLTVGFVMASVLRLAVHARSTEIEIMLLVGATPGFVRGPFLVAGLAQGLLSASMALALVEGLRRAALAYAGSGSLTLVELIAARPMPVDLMLLILLVGTAVSVGSAWFAVRRPEAA